MRNILLRSYLRVLVYDFTLYVYFFLYHYYLSNPLQVLNALNATCEVPMDDTLCVSNLDSIGTIDKGILQPEADIKFFLPVGFYQYTLQELFKPNQYSRFMGKLNKYFGLNKI